MAKSEVHLTSLTCMTTPGEFYKIEKEFFFDKVKSYNSFMRKLEKQCLENVRD